MIKIGGKSYPFTLNNGVYGDVQQETGKNPFGGLQLSAPLSIQAFAFYGINEALREKGQPEIDRQVVRGMNAVEMYEIAEVINDDIGKALDYLEDKLPKNGQEKNAKAPIEGQTVGTDT